MRIAVNAAIINDSGQLLIVRKHDGWILPGGKPNAGEDDESCLEREVREELSGTRIIFDEYYESVEGITPNKGDKLVAKVYLCSLDGELGKPSAEISGSAWMSYDDRTKYNLSGITSKIVEILRLGAAYTGF